jgi:hypothetical protein
MGMEEQLPFAKWLVVPNVPVRIRGDMHIHQPSFES